MSTSVVGATATGAAHPSADATPARLTALQRGGLVLAPLVGLALWFAPTHDVPAAQHAIAVAAAMIVLWATEPFDYVAAGLLGLLVFWTSGIATADRAFAGFARDTVWFVYAAILMGTMATRSGLARRLALALLARAGSSYPRLLFGFLVVDFALTLLVPSGVARVTILGAITIGIVEAFGVGRKSNIGRGLMVIVTYSASIFDKMIIAGATSILARGIIQDATGVPILYSHWFIAFLPCDIITILVCWLLVRRLYPPERDHIEDPGALRRRYQDLGPWTPAEKRCAVYLGGALLLWMTDFVHHLTPTLIAISVGMIGIMPRVGLLSVADLRAVNYRPVWFTATALSMGSVLAQTKALDAMTQAATAWMEPLVTGPVTSALVLYWLAFGYHIFLAHETAMMSTSLPVVLNFASTHGLGMLTTGMIWTFAAGGKIFVYQSAVLVVGYAFGYFDGRDMLKVGLILTIVEWVVLVLLVGLYWPLIGLVG